MTSIIIGALVIGIVLGLLGSGGSAIAVPILVYLVGHDAKVSIAESMAIVAAISLVGSVPYAMAKEVDWRSAMLFGIPTMLGTWIGAIFGSLAADAVQLIIFAIVILAAAILMFRNAFRKRPLGPKLESNQSPDAVTFRMPSAKAILLALEGLAVGLLTGFVGVAGGFLIVPALLLLAKLPMRTAIGTSMVIVSLKSFVGFAKYQSVLLQAGLSIDWTTVIVFTGIGLAGCTFGRRVNSKLDQRTLKQIFSLFLIAVGIFVIVKELQKLS